MFYFSGVLDIDGISVALIDGMEAYMKKAVLMIMVTLFAGSVFASGSSCSNKTNVGMFTSTKPAVSSKSTSGVEGSR